jgi:CheY-like chemotaxis protein
MLERLGCPVLVAVDGQAGLDRLAAHPEIGCVLLD